MIYLVIVLLTNLVTLGIIKLLNYFKRIKMPKIVYRQSTIFTIMKDMIPEELFKKPSVIKQSDKYREKTSFKVIFIADRAYWVLNNVFYTAQAISGQVIEETIQQVDTMNMPQQDLDKMLFILDSLKDEERFNDSGSSGHT